jgi:hypothetical protein
MRAPLIGRALIRIASWIVPARDRSAWLEGRAAELFDWWYLVERGEPVRDEGRALCRRAFADAFAQRFAGADPRQLLRAPMSVPIAAAASLIVLALASHGFAVTRGVIAIAQDIRANPVLRDLHSNTSMGYDFRGDRVFVYAAPIALALTTGLTVLSVGCFTLRARGWRYWSFLAFKALAVVVLLPLIWVELGTALRNLFPAPSGRVPTGRALTGLFTALLLVIAMGRAMIWCVADQRRRCRACLRRLVLPVSVGAWGSLFEPSTTEMLCEEGHGALALSDAETDVRDEWTRLDESWKTLFR